MNTVDLHIKIVLTIIAISLSVIAIKKNGQNYSPFNPKLQIYGYQLTGVFHLLRVFTIHN